MISQSSFVGIPLRTHLQRRALVVGYYALVVAFPVIAMFRSHVDLGILIPQTLTLAGLLGGIRSGGPVKAYEGPTILNSDLSATTPSYPIQSLNLSGTMHRETHLLLDEREQAERDHAHYRAYRILRWTVSGATLLLIFLQSFHSTWLLDRLPVLLWSFLIFTLSLPQCVILWTEPDQPGAGDLTLVSER